MGRWLVEDASISEIEPKPEVWVEPLEPMKADVEIDANGSVNPALLPIDDLPPATAIAKSRRAFFAAASLSRSEL